MYLQREFKAITRAKYTILGPTKIIFAWDPKRPHGPLKVKENFKAFLVITTFMEILDINAVY